MRHIPCLIRAFGLLCMLTGLLSAAEPAATAPTSRPADDATLCARSIVSRGDTTRLARVLGRAERGEKLTVGVIGGSITQGASASSAERRYGNLIAAALRERFPRSPVAFINAGIGATGSSYGTLRARRDLLVHEPHIVIVEYGVNDPNTQACAETLEGLLRQILRAPSRPAVVLLFTMHRDGGNAQEWQEKLGRHYRLPMISFRDAIWPEIRDGRLRWEDVEADVVHPNDRGHAYAAQFVTRFLASVPRGQPVTESAPADDMPLPAPLLTDRYERTTLLEADDLTPVASQGWTYDAAQHCWKSETPGSVLEFEVTGTSIFTMHWVIRGASGRALARVDDRPPVELEGWFEGTWGGYRSTTEIARDLPAGRHRVRIEVQDAHHPQSTGHAFRILGVGTAGN